MRKVLRLFECNRCGEVACCVRFILPNTKFEIGPGCRSSFSHDLFISSPHPSFFLLIIQDLTSDTIFYRKMHRCAFAFCSVSQPTSIREKKRCNGFIRFVAPIKTCATQLRWPRHPVLTPSHYLPPSILICRREAVFCVGLSRHAHGMVLGVWSVF